LNSIWQTLCFPTKKTKQKRKKFNHYFFFIQQNIVIHSLPDYSQSIDRIFRLGSPVYESFLQQECFPALNNKRAGI